MNIKRSVLLTSLALCALSGARAQTPAAPAKPTAAPAAPAVAAPAGATSTAATNSEGIEKITVTARRVDELLSDVPLSIQALSGKELTDRNIGNISELVQFTPGISYSPDLGRVSERPVIRGISALRPEAPQPVSVFLDGVYVRDGALSILLDDTQRVEVIKGPQSALYGRSTYAGAINYIAVKPGNEVKGTVQLTKAGFAEKSIFGAVTLPLLKDVLSMRIKARSYDFGGVYTNTQTGNRIGKERSRTGGLIVSLTPNDAFDATLTTDIAKDRDGLFNATVRTVPTQAGGVVTSQNGSTNVANGGTCNGRVINIVGNNAQGLPDATVPATATARLNGWPCGAATFTGRTVTRNELDLANYVDPATGIGYGNIAGLDRTIERSSLTANYRLGGYTLTGQAAQTRQKSNIGADQSYNGTRFAVTGASWLSYDRDRLNYESYEFRIASPEDRPFTWMAGFFQYDEQTGGQTTGVIARSGTNVVNEALRNKSATSTENSAPFARAQYEFSKALRVSAEVRRNKETVKVGGTPLGTAIVTTGTCVAGQVCTISGERTFEDTSPRVTADFKLNASTMFYAQYATGSKSGGFNLTAGLPTANFAFKGEKVKSFEAGVKLNLLGGKSFVNAALFRNNIDDLQLSNISTVTNPFTGAASTTTIVNNVGKARTQGFEIDGMLRATRWLTLNANYAYTDAKAIEGTEITNGTVFGGNTSVAGFVLPRTPKHSASASVSVDTPLANTGLMGFGRVDVIYQSRRYAEIQNMIWADPYTRINVSGGVRGKDWKVNVWLKNATDDDTSLNGFRYLDPVTFRRTSVDFLPRLRQAGVTVNYDF